MRVEKSVLATSLLPPLTSNLMRRLPTNTNDGNVGFQIAPMIDVVFVIMLFFMLMAGSVKVEKELNSRFAGGGP